MGEKSEERGRPCLLSGLFYPSFQVSPDIAMLRPGFRGSGRLRDQALGLCHPEGVTPCRRDHLVTEDRHPIIFLRSDDLCSFQGYFQVSW